MDAYTTPTRRVFYTASVITPDGSDTNCYGEPCEPGTGYTLAEGWLDPDWSAVDVAESSDDVRPDEWMPDDGRTPVEWLREVLDARLGPVEEDYAFSVYAADDAAPGQPGPRAFDVALIGDVTLYAASAREERHGVTTRRAAHVEGFTFAEVAQAVARTRTAA